MDAALGPPAAMADHGDDLTPMMTQYVELCERYDDALVLFQMGDFYEAFCDAAEVVSRELEVALTQREDSTGTYPMAGVPVRSAASSVETLLDAGYRVAIAEQVEDADEATGVVDRAVTRVVTPGTVVEDELLAPGTANYVACLASETEDGEGACAVAVVDVSTGEFRVTSADSREGVRDELDRFAPKEALLAPEFDGEFDLDCMVTPHDPDAFGVGTARERLESVVSRPEAVVKNDAELRAAGALLAYAAHTQTTDGALDHVTRLTRDDPHDRLELDATALRSLGVFENPSGSDDHTLVDVLDETSCALGRRKLVRWLRRPLRDREKIEARLDAVAELTHASLVREELRDLLRDVYDIERLVGTVSRRRANARDLRALKATLDVVPAIRETLSEADSTLLADSRTDLDGLDDVRGLIGRAIREEPPTEITEGGVIARGFDDDLDELRTNAREGREWVEGLEERERERTGIDSLSVGHNEVHGFYIEVTNPNLDAVPEEYTRRQTLKNSERFYTPELKRREDEILGASERADAREHRLFREVREEVASETERLQALADTLAALDTLATLAHVAVENRYTRPELGHDGVAIRDGRHPVVERGTEFVPNDVDLREERFAVITGPNMSGKSTYMRQVALIQLLAQVGSFVPASEANLPVVDRIFTRIGASDDIAGGESTFMREMTELTAVLHDATRDSLVLLDEVGRGTSTTDGEAIARAVTEFIHDEVGATTLFATHYHDLARLGDELDAVRTLHFAVEGDPDAGDGTGSEGVTFLHTVAEGSASASYGIEVARLAGVPESVVERSRDLVARETGGSEPTTDETNEPGDEQRPVEDGAEAGDEAAIPPETVAELRELRVAELTPVEALVRLDALKRRFDDQDN
ncbi:DNA mismatch repair protein MutS [Halococcus sp. IIIV-5B]|uniref:DNA mismatch repair protein MutS n=1 Tax=Halococcus sp. IIIV-5B TaxID=2321230 RepID=UPI000E732FD4|nr:DNA mismatch repair protein MutS [Halococcus sp. IIIV-5B]RJT06086.1 DNA mismatch repair protein MutS [Halococcus sp. IIIV-5B]